MVVFVISIIFCIKWNLVDFKLKENILIMSKKEIFNLFFFIVMFKIFFFGGCIG